MSLQQHQISLISSSSLGVITYSQTIHFRRTCKMLCSRHQIRPNSSLLDNLSHYQTPIGRDLCSTVLDSIEMHVMYQRQVLFTSELHMVLGIHFSHLMGNHGCISLTNLYLIGQLLTCFKSQKLLKSAQMS